MEESAQWGARLQALCMVIMLEIVPSTLLNLGLRKGRVKSTAVIAITVTTAEPLILICISYPLLHNK